jgi:hypothetical protein
VSGFNWSRLYSEHKEYVDQWLENYAFVVMESHLTKAEKHKRFIDVNSGNVLSDQDKRSSLDCALSTYLNEMVLGTKPWYNFLKVDTTKMEFVHIPSISVQGKVIQEVISKVLVYGFAGEYTNIGKTGIDRLFADFCGETKTIKTEHNLELLKPTIEEVMKTANYVIENSASKDFWKKRDVMILLIVLWDLIYSKKKFDSKLLRTGYIKTIQKLKGNNGRLNKWAFEIGYLYDMNGPHPKNKLADSIRERDNTFASCYSAGDSPITLEFVIESIKDSITVSKISSSFSTTRNSFDMFNSLEKDRINLKLNLSMVITFKSSN